MDFNINRLVLLDALTKVSRAVSLKSPLPILTGIKFDLLEDGLVLTATDSDISIQIMKVLLSTRLDQLFYLLSIS